MGAPTVADCPWDTGDQHHLCHALCGQLQSSVRELSGLARALSGAALDGDGRMCRDDHPVFSDDLDDAFHAVAAFARLELLEVRSCLPTGDAAPSGLRHRVILGSHPGSRSGLAERVDELAGRGVQIRTAGLLPVRIAVTDRSAVAVALEAGDGCGYLVVERRRSAARRVAARFLEHWWRRARPLGTAEPVQPVEGAAFPGPSRTEAAVIAGLTRGLTDESVARRVGITPRTVRRHVAAVCERYGATSRLQLGVLIGQSVPAPVSRCADGGVADPGGDTSPPRVSRPVRPGSPERPQ